MIYCAKPYLAQLILIVYILSEEKIIQYLASNWNRCGIDKGDVLLVHSSLKRLLSTIENDHGVSMSPEDIYRSLLEALGENGTLILPLFNFDFPKTSFFDIRNTPSQMGTLSEIGRTDKRSVRTGHPIYSFSVIGKRASEFGSIDNYSGYGPDSPFAKLRALDGKIAIIGLDDQFSMTSYHFVEEQNQVDYRYLKEFNGTYVDGDGEESIKKYAIYVRDLERGVTTDVNRMMDHLWANGYYMGDPYNEGLGMRTIKFNDLYNESDRIIKEGLAIDYLYSIKLN